MTHPNDAAHPMLDKSGTADGVTHYAYIPHSSLTKREQFAAMALQGLLSNHEGFGLTATQAGELLGIENYDNVRDFPALCALMAVRFADHLIEALNTPTETT